MPEEPPISSCTFGWGKKFQLFRGYMEIAGRRYMLQDLTSVQIIYRHLFGVSSARVVLKMRQRTLVLRGIPDLEDARKIAATIGARGISLEQRTLPAGKRPLRQADQPIVRLLPPRVEKIGVPQITVGPLSDTSRVTREFEKVTVAVPKAPIAEEHLKAPPLEHVMEPLTLKAEIVPPKRTHRFDESKLHRRLKEEHLPVLTVPILLLTAEEAHYSTQATLCGERSGGTTRGYPPIDHGLLILTNMRMLYLGRRRQIVLDYHALLHVSRLRGAIAFQAEQWTQRAIFDVERPLECAMYLECILQRFQQADAPNTVESTFLPQTPSELSRKRDTAEIETVRMGKYDWDATELRSNMPCWLKQLEASRENQTIS